MKKLTNLLSVLLILCMMAALTLPALAATSETAVIDHTKTGSVTIYKYDYTNAANDGAWDDSYSSTGVHDQDVTDTLGSTGKVNSLGNGETSNGYAIAGVEFTYLKVADFRTYSQAENGTAKVLLLYGFAADDALPGILGLDASDAYTADADKNYFESDTVIDALKNALTTSPTTTKSALERYITSNAGTAMELTDANGMTTADGMALGLYLFVETKVPEMVVSTTNPWLVSLPMTSVNGTNATNGGQEWLYDITLYPKNQTGIPTLEKTVREDKADTGSNGDTDVITDGFAHTGTASAGDILDYQIISTLPTITSSATYLKNYTFTDTLSAGISYIGSDIVLTWYKDAACTEAITSWDMNSGMFTASVSAYSGMNILTIAMTEDGLDAINTSNEVWNDSTVKSGYSDCTLRITYGAKVDSDDSLVLGDKGNSNDVVLSWQRTSANYYDTLLDDCHIYSYGVDLTKVFSDAKGNYANVNFVLKNSTDSYWVQARQDADTGIYYVTGHVNAETDATKFVPTSDGKIIVKGLEDDTYILTETQTDNGYVLLERGIEITITTAETTEACGIYSNDTIGVVQTKEHKLLTASAAVDADTVTMLADNSSDNALAALEVVNNRISILPGTGDVGAYTLAVIGTLAAVSCIGAIIVILKLKRENRQ